MLRITCPVCGLRDEVEFSYGGDASVHRPDLKETSQEIWNDYLFIRPNIRGLHREYWQHVHGCRQWIIVERDTRNHRIASSELAIQSQPDSLNSGDPA